MTTPLPWSPSALDQFVNCPRQFYEVRVAKTVKQEQTEQQKWGEYVHKEFELCQNGERKWGNTGPAPLPPDLEKHIPFMIRLWAKPGEHFTELKGGFDRKARPCHFLANDVWCRLVIDYVKVDRESQSAFLVDYKTGKPHSKFEQLYLYCLYIFATYPFVNLINAQFYWTQTQTVTKKVIGRNEIEELWDKFIPNLKQYATAFKTNTWQERQSGLCKNHCPVRMCGFNGKSWQR